jgi:predicted NAD/FAD-dependent oxidoreductase
MKHIGIVGAGPAGLSAAWYLKKRGYRRITLLERENVLGGKCQTLTYRGRPYELGAVMGTCGYRNTLELMDQVGVAPVYSAKPTRERGDPTLLKRGYVARAHVVPGYFSYGEALRLGRQLWRYRRLTRRYEKLYAPGLCGLPKELHTDFSSWVERHGMDMFAKMIEPPCTGFGYGYLESVPAAYVLKYMDTPTILSILYQRRVFKWGEGAQSLWDKMARGFEVRLRTEVKSVSRGPVISVDTDAGRFRFDDLILTAPLDEALGYLDAGEQEKDLFGKIRHVTYCVLACEIDGLDIPSGFAPVNFDPGRRGHLLIWSRPWHDLDLYLLYAQAQSDWDERDVMKRLEEDLAEMGARILRIESFKKWKYFPHVPADVLRAGFYERLEGLQGRLRTYYAGEVMSFSSIEHTVRYSRHLVERFFPDCGSGGHATVPG